MLNIFRTAFLFIFILVLANVLPEFNSMAFQQKVDYPYILYSNIIKKFSYFKYQKSYLDYKPNCFDEDGNKYSFKEFKKINPLFYSRDAKKFGMLPLKIKSKTYTYEMIKDKSYHESIRLKYLNYPTINLYPLLESKPQFSRLELPNDMFRINSRIEFINCFNNEIDEKKSSLFTRSMVNAGFKFPALTIAGNPSTRKEYDDGYFIEDANNQIFHLKMQKGHPVVKATGIKVDAGIKFFKIAEDKRKGYYGYFITKNKKLFFIGKKNYKLIELKLENYDPTKMNLTIVANPIQKLFRYSDDNKVYCSLTDINYNELKKYEYSLENASASFFLKIYEIFFPFEVITKTGVSSYVKLDFKFYGLHSLWGILLALIIFGVFAYFRLFKIKYNLLSFSIILISGFYGLICIFLTRPFEKNR